MRTFVVRAAPFSGTFSTLPRRASDTLALALAFATSACAGGSERATSSGVSRTDSAGIAIVTNETPADAVPVFATLDSVPGLKVGSVDGPKEEQLASVRAVTPLSDGGVAVLEGQAAEIRIFGADGSYVRTVARKGEGPGEITFPVTMAQLTGDTLAVYDARNGRITRFGPDGTLGRIVTLQLEGYGRPYVATLLPDGSLVGQLRYSGAPGGFPDTSGELTAVTDSVAVVVIGPDGSLRDTADVLPAGESLRRVQRSGQMTTISTSDTDFSHVNVFAAGPDGVWSGYGDHFALRLLDLADGHPKTILRAPGLDRRLTDAEVKQIRDQALAEAKTPAQRRAVQEALDLSPPPEQRPSYDRLLVDDQARVWLREWRGAQTGPDRWWVFSRDGTLVGSVHVPQGLRLMVVRNGQAWGVIRDDLDVPYVVRYAVHATKG